MNILAPVRRDRVIAELPPCFTKGAALHSRSSFHPKVVGMCQSQRTGTVGFKISKIIVVGDLSVGKTCLINRFCKDTFDKNYKATIGVDFEMERFEVLGVPFSLQLWDTAGQERFKCIASTYYRGAQAIIIVFDLNDVASLGHTRQWLADALKENDPSSAILFLVGTKKDLSVSWGEKERGRQRVGCILPAPPPCRTFCLVQKASPANSVQGSFIEAKPSLLQPGSFAWHGVGLDDPWRPLPQFHNALGDEATDSWRFVMRAYREQAEPKLLLPAPRLATPPLCFQGDPGNLIETWIPLDQPSSGSSQIQPGYLSLRGQGKRTLPQTLYSLSHSAVFVIGASQGGSSLPQAASNLKLTLEGSGGREEVLLAGFLELLPLSFLPPEPFPSLSQSPAQYSLIEREALKVAKEMEAEYWAVSSLTGKFLFCTATLFSDEMLPSTCGWRLQEGRVALVLE
uniref:Ras-related protein Rab-36 n=1 Tax=Podarcis muralis TaxID=64176 RepID=A0A670JR94_PODMU